MKQAKEMFRSVILHKLSVGGRWGTHKSLFILGEKKPLVYPTSCPSGLIFWRQIRTHTPPKHVSFEAEKASLETGTHEDDSAIRTYNNAIGQTDECPDPANRYHPDTRTERSGAPNSYSDSLSSYIIVTFPDYPNRLSYSPTQRQCAELTGSPDTAARCASSATSSATNDARPAATAWLPSANAPISFTARHCSPSPRLLRLALILPMRVRPRPPLSRYPRPPDPGLCWRILAPRPGQAHVSSGSDTA